MQTPKPLGFEINLDRFKKSNPFVWAKGMEGYNRIRLKIIHTLKSYATGKTFNHFLQNLMLTQSP